MPTRIPTALVVLLFALSLLMGCASSIVHGEGYKISELETQPKPRGARIEIFFAGQRPDHLFMIIGKVIARSDVPKKGMEELKDKARELGADGIINIRYDRKFSINYWRDLYYIDGDAVVWKN